MIRRIVPLLLAAAVAAGAQPAETLAGDNLTRVTFTLTNGMAVKPVDAHCIDASRSTACIARGVPELGVPDASLLITVDGVLDALPPAVPMTRGVLRFECQPHDARPAFDGIAPAAPLGVWRDSHKALFGSPPDPLALTTGQTGCIELDMLVYLQPRTHRGNLSRWVLELAIPPSQTGAVDVAIRTLAIDIEYGPVEERHRLPAPRITRAEAMPDRTISLWWEPAAPAEPLWKVSYWYEFERFVDAPQLAARKAAHDIWRKDFEKAAAVEITEEIFQEIEEYDENSIADFSEIDDEFKMELPEIEEAANMEFARMTWQEAWSTLPWTPPDPGEFHDREGQWMPLDVPVYAGSAIRGIEAHRSYARINLGEYMPREDLAYRFRMRARASNGQVGPWSEASPEVRQHNPGYLVWASDMSYKARHNYSPNRDPALADAYALNYYNMEWGISLAAARDEYEPFQLYLMHELDGPRTVRLELDPLVSDSGNRIELWAMHPHRVIFLNQFKQAGDDPNAALTHKMPPNILGNVFLPFEDPHSHRPIEPRRYFPNPHVTLPREVMGYFVDLHVPGSAPAGIYRGNATLVLGDDARFDIPIELEVFDFFMPRRRTVATTFGDAGPGRERAADFDRWVKTLHAHRANGYGARVRPYPNVYVPSRETYTGVSYLDTNWQLYDRVMQPYVDGAKFEDGVPMRKFGVTSWYLSMSQIPDEVAYSGYTDRGKAADDNRANLLMDYLRDFRLHALDGGYANRLWYYEEDEPMNSPNTMCPVDMVFFHLKQAFPEMKCMITSVVHDMHRGFVTAYNTNPTSLMKYTVNGMARVRFHRGEEWWLYNAFVGCNEPNSYMDQRFCPWYAWRQGSQCWLQWITCRGLSWDFWPFFGGDGDMMYPLMPGNSGMRGKEWFANFNIKLWREGMEDIEYLELAKQAVGIDEVNRIIRQVSWSDDWDDFSPRGEWARVGSFRNRGGMHYNADPNALRKVRRELAELIVKHRPDDGRPARSVPELIASARSLLADDQPRAALFEAKKALCLDPGNWEAGVLEVECYHQVDMPEEMHESALRLVRRHDTPAAWKTLGDVYARMSRLVEADEAWEEALWRKPPPDLQRDIETAMAEWATRDAKLLKVKVEYIVGGGETMMLEGLHDWQRWPPCTHMARHKGAGASGGNIWRGVGKWGGYKTVPPTDGGLTMKIVPIDIHALPRGARIRRAYLELQANIVREKSEDGKYVISTISHGKIRRDLGAEITKSVLAETAYVVYPVIKHWVPQYLTWRHRDKNRPWAEPGCGRPGVDRGPLYSPATMCDLDFQTSLRPSDMPEMDSRPYRQWPDRDEGAVFRLDMTRIVRDWVDGKYPNHGIAVAGGGATAMGGLIMGFEQPYIWLKIYYTVDE